MIEEQYVSFEVAKLLREKGFNGFCERFYDFYPETGEVYICGCDEHDNSRYANEYSMPTQQMAMRWLREVHHIHICPEYKAFFQEKPKKIYHHWCCNAVGIDRYFRQGVHDISRLDPDYFFFRSCKTYHDTYEDACEETIEYCLKHLID